MAARTEKFSFSDRDGNRLDGRLDRPEEGGARAFALFAHCFTCTKDSLAATRLSAALAARGIAVLRFDFTGLGGSEGDFANAGFASNVENLAAAADALREREAAPALLVGHSLGGAAVLAAAAKIGEARAVATIGAPFDADHVLGRLGEELKKVEAQGEAEVTIGGRSFRVAKGFLEQTREQPQEERIAELGRALLVLHSPVDDVVGLENAGLIFQAARHPKSFVALDGADHLLTSEKDADYAAGVIAAWAEAYLPR